MISLFESLLGLHKSNKPTEDFFTEIFAFSLAKHPKIVLSFLNDFVKIKVDKNQDIVVKTQVSFDRLANHYSDSKPDIYILIDDYPIFIECKIDSSENEGLQTADGGFQLKKYAEHLNNSFSKGHLLYITKNYDPKDKGLITGESNISFLQLRWHQVYHFFLKFKDIEIVEEILKFMTLKDMAFNNQFLPIDILTLSNFSKVRKLLDECMYAEVEGRFTQLTNGRISKHSANLTQVRNHDRYAYWGDLEGYSLLLGFNFNNQETGYPDVFFYIEIYPSSTKRDILKEIYNNSRENWSTYNLNDPKAYAGLSRSKSLQDFMSSSDHVSEIKRFFLGCLDEYEKIKEKLD